MIKRYQLKRNKFILLLAMVLLFSTFAGCTSNSDGNNNSNSEEPDELSAPVKIAALKGPSGIGMVQLMEDTEKYQITVYQNPDEVVGKIITGEIEVASIPSNLAGVLYKKTEGQVVVLTTNTLGVLYLVENGNTVSNITDLAGKTIAASGKGGAPEYILNRLLLDAGLDPATDVNIQWMANHSDVASTLLSKEGTVTLLPEPFVTVVSNKNKLINIAVDLNSVWKDSYKMDLPMGTLVAQKSFVEQRDKDLKIFMDDYANSVAFVNSDHKAAAVLISKHGLIDDISVAELAIPKCNIVFIDHYTDNKAMLDKFYEILYDMEPKSVGGQIPDDEFYYNWTNE